jgi:hypothetical protein
MKKIGICIVMGLLLLCFFAYGFEKPTHMEINRDTATRSFNEFSLDSYLISQLGLSKGVTEEFNRKQIIEWLGEGGKAEDEPEDISRQITGRARNKNHFHNPLAQTWETAGLQSGLYTGESSVRWAQNKNQSPGGKWSWYEARDYYYKGLTLTDKKQRDSAMANCFRALGQLMHLIQDASVPAHVRNDIHLIYHYENWLEDMRTRGSEEDARIFASFIANPISFDKDILKHDPNSIAPVPIAKIIDTDRYTGTNPAITVQNLIGIAEYTNANFFSEDTVFSDAFPYPGPTSSRIEPYIIPDPRDSSKTVIRKYVYKYDDGATGYRLATVGLLKEYIMKHFPFYKGREENSLDGGVYEDYARRLLPRAVGYSAGLLEYFFRGRLQVTSLPIFYRNGIHIMRVKIKNITPTAETMTNGWFTLTYRYTPTGGPSDGSQDIFGQSSVCSSDLPCNELKFQDETSIDFVLPALIPRENYDSVKFTLVFKGTLGNEEGAVIGRFFTPGEIKFNEEWDNGLTGNHTWAHTDFDTSRGYPGHGSTSNTLVGDVLIKENIRYAGYRNPSVNASFVGNNSIDPMYNDIFPILITPNTSLQFKLDNMSINQIPPSPPGTTAHYQGLWLNFNHGLVIQLSTDQFVYYTPQTAYFTFELGRIFVNNIYKMFQDSVITIPAGDLYLERIEFVQQLFDLEDNSAVEHRQHMEVDSIRIIEEKLQEDEQ